MAGGPRDFTFSVADDMPGGAVNTNKLRYEIDSASSVPVTVDDLTESGDVLAINFQADLTSAQETALHGDTSDPAGGLLASHDNTPTQMDPYQDPDGVRLVRQHPQTPDYLLVNRDIKFCTSIYAEADSLEDKRVDPSTNLEADWGEVKLIGVYKDDGEGGMEACDDQDDADTNCILSVWEYQALDRADGETPIIWETAGGKIFVDPDLSTEGEWDYRFYAIGAPNIPFASGGQIPFFDGYLQRFAGTELECCSSTVKTLNPAASSEISKIRFYFFHPAGKKHEHVLRFVTYRPWMQ